MQCNRVGDGSSLSVKTREISSTATFSSPVGPKKKILFFGFCGYDKNVYNEVAKTLVVESLTVL